MATNICDSGAGLSVTGCNFFLSFFFKDRLFIFINLSYMHMEGGLATVHQLQRATVTIFFVHSHYIKIICNNISLYTCQKLINCMYKEKLIINDEKIIINIQ